MDIPAITRDAFEEGMPQYYRSRPVNIAALRAPAIVAGSMRAAKADIGHTDGFAAWLTRIVANTSSTNSIRDDCCSTISGYICRGAAIWLPNKCVCLFDISPIKKTWRTLCRSILTRTKGDILIPCEVEKADIKHLYDANLPSPAFLTKEER